jgi:antitoxin (DNA-binding transcriptional repressor) of toxin-antitoxin stability system
MKTASVADLRNNFRRISSWIEAGETIQILKRGHAFALLVAVPQKEPGTGLVKPDIMAQLKRAWGAKVFSQEEVQSMREAELSEDLG